MRAGISFTIYGDYYKHVVIDGWDADYTKALRVLNNELKELVENGKLAFKYEDKEVTIELPIPYYHAGNIFFPEDGACWESVDIYCDIKGVKAEDFDHKKLKVSKSPSRFNAKGRMW